MMATHQQLPTFTPPVPQLYPTLLQQQLEQQQQQLQQLQQYILGMF